MSDQSQGQGWWLASDGKWYPPEAVPGMTAAPPPPPTSAEQVGLDAGQPGLPSRAWRRYRNWPVWGQVVAGVVLLAALSAPFAGSGDEKVTTTRDTSEVAAPETKRTTTTREATTTTAKPTPTTLAPTTTTAPPPPPPPPPTTAPPPPPITEAPFGTVSQTNARHKAMEYLDYTSFSRSGLIDQLQYEGFSEADATYGVDALNVNWNEQAAKKAAEYLDYTSFSRSGLIDQLLYEGFTPAQAEYGVSTTGL